MIYIGIDPSTVNNGIAVYDRDKHTLWLGCKNLEYLVRMCLAMGATPEQYKVLIELPQYKGAFVRTQKNKNRFAGQNEGGTQKIMLDAGINRGVSHSTEILLGVLGVDTNNVSSGIRKEARQGQVDLLLKVEPVQYMKADQVVWTGGGLGFKGFSVSHVYDALFFIIDRVVAGCRQHRGEYLVVRNIMELYPFNK